jgi:hypothetical protein
LLPTPFVAGMCERGQRARRARTMRDLWGRVGLGLLRWGKGSGAQREIDQNVIVPFASKGLFFPFVSGAVLSVFDINI